MRIWKIGCVVVILLILSMPTFFIYTRFGLEKYELNGNKLTFNNSVYIDSGFLSASDEENLGRTIGIAIDGERTMNDYIWPLWVIEYRNDKEHNKIFVRGLMGSGGVYNKSLE